MNTRRILWLTCGVVCGLWGPSWAASAQTPAGDGSRLNVLLITADDLNYDSIGAAGGKVDDITPNIDRLATEGMRFIHGHVTIAVCQPCRSVWMTGRYPHRNGALGFQPIDPAVPTLGESLRAAGYLNGILAKVGHLAPERKFCWDVIVRPPQLGAGRDPALYYRHAKAFFEQARKSGQPFFLMANSQDPHRPFAGSQQERKRFFRQDRNRRPFPPPGRQYAPNEVIVPRFLPDIPDVRREIAQYFGSVHRCDETVGAVLRALDDTGHRDDTLVMFLGDHGMALPFAKTNCYLTSTRTPWIIRRPGRIKPGTVDREHFVSGIDLMPTILEAAGLPPVADIDGRSFAPLLTGGKQAGRDRVFTVFHRTAGKRDYPMRCLQDGRFGYIYNGWSDGKTVFRNESQSGLSFKAMQAAARTDEKIAARVKLFQVRVREELYDVANDPAALHNLVDDPRYQDALAGYRADMRRTMASVEDPLLPAFERDMREREAPSPPGE